MTSIQKTEQQPTYQQKLRRSRVRVSLDRSMRLRHNRHEKGLRKESMAEQTEDVDLRAGAIEIARNQEPWSPDYGVQQFTTSSLFKQTGKTARDPVPESLTLLIGAKSSGPPADILSAAHSPSSDAHRLNTSAAASPRLHHRHCDPQDYRLRSLPRSVRASQLRRFSRNENGFSCSAKFAFSFNQRDVCRNFFPIAEHNGNFQVPSITFSLSARRGGERAMSKSRRNCPVNEEGG